MGICTNNASALVPQVDPGELADIMDRVARIVEIAHAVSHAPQEAMRYLSGKPWPEKQWRERVSSERGGHHRLRPALTLVKSHSVRTQRRTPSWLESRWGESSGCERYWSERHWYGKPWSEPQWQRARREIIALAGRCEALAPLRQTFLLSAMELTLLVLTAQAALQSRYRDLYIELYGHGLPNLELLLTLLCDNEDERRQWALYLLKVAPLMKRPAGGGRTGAQHPVPASATGARYRTIHPSRRLSIRL